MDLNIKELIHNDYANVYVTINLFRNLVHTEDKREFALKKIRSYTVKKFFERYKDLKYTPTEEELEIIRKLDKIAEDINEVISKEDIDLDKLFKLIDEGSNICSSFE